MNETHPLGTNDILSMVMGLAVTVPNTWTLITIACNRALRHTGNIYMAGLATTDLMAGIFIAAYETFAFLGYKALLVEKAWACLTFTTCTSMSVYASILISSVIAVDRYLYISHPYFYERMVTPKRVVLSMVCAWCLAAGIAILRHAIRSMERDEACFQNVPTKADVYILLPVYLTCCLITGPMYALISRTALFHLKRLASQGPRPAAASDQDPSVQDQLLQRLRAVKMFMVVFGTLFLCLTPYVVVRTLHVLATPPPTGVKNGSALLVLLNSFLNPHIYLALNAEFREAFTRCCRCKSQTRPSQEAAIELA